MAIDQEWTIFLEETHKIKKEVWQKHGLHFDKDFLYIPYYSYNRKTYHNKKRFPPTFNGESKYMYGWGARVQLWPYQDLSSGDVWIITEGELDQLTLESYGFAAVTSGSATSFQRHFVNSFKGKKVYICYDNDKAGKDGAERLAQIFLEDGADVDIIDLPEMDGGKDIGDFFRLGHTKEEFEELIKNARKPTLQQDDDSKKSKGAESEEDERHKVILTADFPELVDLVEEDGNVKFLTFDGQLYPSIILDDQSYPIIIGIPPDEVPWLVPNANKVIEEFSKHSVKTDDTDDKKGCTYCQNELYPSLITYFKQFSEAPTEYHYHYLVWMAFHSYLIEKFSYSPILFFVGSKGRGKTPTLKALTFISRRGVFTQTFREANIIRWSGDYKASLFFDVKNFPKQVELNKCEDLIYGRAERGVEASRVLHPERGPFHDMRSFFVFGVTGATSNYMVDDITEARCIVYNMPFSTKIFNLEPSPELGLPFREKLVAFRMAHFKTPFVEVNKEQPGKLENYLRGYHQMVKTLFPLYEDRFLAFKKIVQEQKQEEAGNSFDARIIKLVDGLKESVEQGTLCLTYDEICKTYNEGKENTIEERSMAHILKGLGFKSKKNSEGTKRGIFYDEDFIKFLKLSYGLEEMPSQESSESSETSEVQPQNNDALSHKEDSGTKTLHSLPTDNGSIIPLSNELKQLSLLSKKAISDNQDLNKTVEQMTTNEILEIFSGKEPDGN